MFIGVGSGVWGRKWIRHFPTYKRRRRKIFCLLFHLSPPHSYRTLKLNANVLIAWTRNSSRWEYLDLSVGRHSAGVKFEWGKENLTSLERWDGKWERRNMEILTFSVLWNKRIKNWKIFTFLYSKWMKSVFVIVTIRSLSLREIKKSFENEKLLRLLSSVDVVMWSH